MAERIEVFLSYAHRDERLRAALDSHLSLLKRDGTIAVWHDRMIDAGGEWRQEIDAHLDSAQIVLALVSPSFLASDYCYELEMTRVLARHDAGEARVIPVILRPVDWQTSPLGSLQALPTNAKPVASWKDRDAALADVADGVRRVAKELRDRSIPGPNRADASVAQIRPQIWNVPHFRNPNFTGRETEIDRVRQTFLSGGRGDLVQVLCGLAGVGKTQLAVEYIHRNAQNYAVVWWISADEPARLAADYSRLAADLGLAVSRDTDEVAVVQSVRAWLEQTFGWLLVFDDARDPRDLRPYLPRSTSGHVLIASRNPNWRGLGRPLAITVPPRRETIQFLLRRTGQDDVEAAGQIASCLGDLPLALEQAAAYVEEKGKSLAQYLALFQSHQRALIKAATQGDHSAGVETVWELSFREAKKSAPAAADLLNICAFLAPDDIPFALFIEHREALPPRLRKAVSDPLAFDKALESLRRFSLVEITDDALSVHALVQAVARDRLAERGKRTCATAAIGVLHDLFLFDRQSVETWREAARLLPHVLAATAHAEALNVEVEVTARLRDQAGLDLRPGVELARAKELFEHALATDQETYGPDHPRVAVTTSNLAAALEASGDLDGARQHYERVLQIDERALGADDPAVATDASKLGGVLRAQGDLLGARRHYERALEIDEHTFGDDHPLVAAELGEIGLTLRMDNDLPGAMTCYERALAIERLTYAHRHPKIAARIADLAAVRRAAGDLAGARALYEQALAITHSVYRPNHVTVAERALELAGVLVAEKDYARAREQYNHAADVFRATLGEHHPRTVAVRRTVASLGDDLAT
jgi:tetratricopeptide (TPR) repeat protein